METAQTSSTEGPIGLLSQIQTQYGLIVMILVAITAFSCFLFWRLVWKVWSETLRAKDAEIARLSKDRDSYQTWVFEQLKAPETLNARDEKRPGSNENPVK